MPSESFTARTSPRTVLVALLAAAFLLAACGEDDAPGPEGPRDTGASEETAPARPRGEQAEREARAIAEELKELQREVAESGRGLVEGSDEGRDAAKGELRGQERRARQLAERVERNLPSDATGRAELRAAARQTERGVAELRRFADGNEDRLARANEQLEAAEGRLRSVAGSLREQASEEDARRALEKLRERVPDIPMP